MNEIDKLIISNSLEKLKAHTYTQQEFVDKLKSSAKTYDLYKHSKVGRIKITKVSDNAGYLGKNESREGWVFAFGEGLGCLVESGARWFHTSVVEKIDWENNTFDTMNSTYAFEFKEEDPEKLIKLVENDD